MVDPEVLSKELLSGSSATLRGQADTVRDSMKKVDQSTTRIAEAADRPKWSSATSGAYMVRTAGVTQAIKVNYIILGRIQTTASGMLRPPSLR